MIKCRSDRIVAQSSAKTRCYPAAGITQQRDKRFCGFAHKAGIRRTVLHRAEEKYRPGPALVIAPLSDLSKKLRNLVVFAHGQRLDAVTLKVVDTELVPMREAFVGV